MKPYIFPLLMVYFMTGCGGGTSDTITNTNYDSSDGNISHPSQSNITNPSEIDMKLNHPYTVYPGDKIEKTSDDAEVTIAHIDGHKESKVTLIAGSAILTRK